jgi:uncharacterized SAM-binding protein YcdF (DUF218 family)
MEFYLSKVLVFFFNPLNILFLIILIHFFVIFFLESKKLTRIFSAATLIVFLLLGCLPVSNFLLNKIEDFITPSRHPTEKLAGIVVLGGSATDGLASKERNEVLLNDAAERLTKALEIYKKNHKVIILFSGFSGKINPQGWDESELAKKFFIDQGVSTENLLFENKSRNTFENVIFSKDIIKKYRGTWGLVTSASHMPRSYFLFKKQNVILEPISVDFKTGTSQIFWLTFDLSRGLINWRIIFHEMIGISYYKIINKI